MIATRLRNQIELEKVLDMYATQLRRRRRRSAAALLDQITRQRRNGATFAEAIRPWIPVDELMMITSGERASNLPDAVELIGDVKNRIRRIVRTIRTAGMIPIVYMISIYGFVWTIGTYLTPKLESVMPASKATGLASALFAMGDGATSFWMLLPVTLLLILIGGVTWSMPRATGPLRTWLENSVPYSFYRDIQGYMWLLSFAALLKAGMPDIQALELQRQNGNRWLRHRLSAVMPLMTDNGDLFPEALRKTGLNFPNPDMIDDIEAVWGFSDTNERLMKVTREWADDLEQNLTDRIKTVGMVFEIVMYAVIGFVLIATNSLSTQLADVPMG
jgi:type II secretory pathway component PulF